MTRIYIAKFKVCFYIFTVLYYDNYFIEPGSFLVRLARFRLEDGYRWLICKMILLKVTYQNITVYYIRICMFNE